MNNDLISRSTLLEEFEWLKMTVGSGSVGSINDAIERVKKPTPWMRCGCSGARIVNFQGLSDEKMAACLKEHLAALLAEGISRMYSAKNTAL